MSSATLRMVALWIVGCFAATIVGTPPGLVAGRAEGAVAADMSFQDPGNNYKPYINFFRTAGSHSGVYNYSVHYFPCEIDGGTDFSGSIRYDFKLHNGDNTWSNVSYGPVVYGLIQKNNCANSQILQFVTDTTNLYCCGTAVMTVVNGSDTDAQNNQANDNNLYVSMLALETRIVKLNILNWGAAVVTFDVDVDEDTVPPGWTVFVSPVQIEVAAGTEGFFNLSITAPGTVVAWPEIDVWASASNHPALSQSSRVKVLDGSIWEDDDPCA